MVRPSRTASALVVHPDPEVREGWARSLEASGMRVTRCVGPIVSCILDRGGARCPLVDDVDLGQPLAGQGRQRLFRHMVATAHQLFRPELDRKISAAFQQPQLPTAGNLGDIDDFDRMGRVRRIRVGM